MMMISSLLKNTLWALRYPRLSSDVLGPFKEIGSLQLRLSDDSVNCQVLYPAADAPKTGGRSFHPYFRPEAATGVCQYVKADPNVLDFLTVADHPCQYGAQPNQDRRFPIVLFSHGLAGCCEMYTQLCQQIASYGFIVIAMEHEDGSASYAETKVDGTAIPYERPDDTPYSREKVLKLRTPMLKQRVQEVQRVLSILQDKQACSNESLLDQILATIDLEPGVSLVGHSFGGITMALVAQELDTKFRCLTMLDPWAFAVSDETLKAGIKDDVPVLSILCERWTTNNAETAQVKDLLEHCHQPISLYVRHSIHQSVADSVCWLPTFVATRMSMRGPLEQRHQTIRATAAAFAQHWKGFGGEPNDFLATLEEKDPSISLLYEFDYANGQFN